MKKVGSSPRAQRSVITVEEKIPKFTKHGRLLGVAAMCQDSGLGGVDLQETMSHNNNLCDIKPAQDAGKQADQGNYPEKNMSHNSQDQLSMGATPLCPRNRDKVPYTPPTEFCEQITKNRIRRGGRIA